MPSIVYSQKALDFLIDLAILDKKLLKKIRHNISLLKNYPHVQALWIKKLKNQDNSKKYSSKIYFY